MECTNYQPHTLQVNYHASVAKNISSSYAFVGSMLKLHPLGALQFSGDVGQTSDFGKCCQAKPSGHLSGKQTLNDEFHVDDCHAFPENICNQKNKEMERRRKIGLANKGKVPWNAGRKHSAETRAKIKQRTAEAMRNPQVRMKLSIHSRPQSDEIKKKIGYAVSQNWAKRLKWKHLGKKFFMLWAESIAEAARKGGSEHQELDWDSYDHISQEIAVQQLQLAAEKAKAKELRTERLARGKEEKEKKVAQMRKEQEELASEKAKAKELRAQRLAQAKEEKKTKVAQMRKEQEELASEKAKAKGLRAQKLVQEKEEKKTRIAQMGKEQEEKERAKAKRVKIAKKAKIAARAKAEKMERPGRRRVQGEKTTEGQETKRKICSKSEKHKEDVPVDQGSKLKWMLMKILKTKSINGQFTSGEVPVISTIRSWQKLDIELIKREKDQRKVSLADQIQTAKNKRKEFTVKEIRAPSSAVDSNG